MNKKGFAAITAVFFAIVVLAATTFFIYNESRQQRSHSSGSQTVQNPSGVQDLGPAPDDYVIDTMTIYFSKTPQQQAAENELLDEQQNASSPRYHQWITPEQYGQQFGASTDTISAVSDWLIQHNLAVQYIANGKDFIWFSGVVAQINNAFHVAIHKYSVNGTICYAEAGGPKVIGLTMPSQFSSVIEEAGLPNTCYPPNAWIVPLPGMSHSMHDIK